jgi:hypothetical protein
LFIEADMQASRARLIRCSRCRTYSLSSGMAKPMQHKQLSGYCDMVMIDHAPLVSEVARSAILCRWLGDHTVQPSVMM